MYVICQSGGRSARDSATLAAKGLHPVNVTGVFMAYTAKFKQLADAARARVSAVAPKDVDSLLAAGAIALDIRDKEEHDADHIPGSLHVSRGKLEMNVEGVIPVSRATGWPFRVITTFSPASTAPNDTRTP